MLTYENSNLISLLEFHHGLVLIVAFIHGSTYCRSYTQRRCRNPSCQGISYSLILLSLCLLLNCHRVYSRNVFFTSIVSSCRHISWQLSCWFFYGYFNYLVLGPVLVLINPCHCIISFATMTPTVILFPAKDTLSIFTASWCI